MATRVTGRAATATVDGGGVVTGWSVAAERLTGFGAGRVLGRPAVELLAGEAPVALLRAVVRHEPFTGMLRLCRSEEEPVAVELGAVPVRTARGEPAWVVSAQPLRPAAAGSAGPGPVGPALAAGSVEERARRRLALLGEAALRIGSTLEVERTAQELAEVAIGGFADFVGVDLLDSVFGGGPPSSAGLVFYRVAQRSVLPGCPESAVVAGRGDVIVPDSPMARVLAAGRPLRSDYRDPEIRSWITQEPERERRAEEFGIHSALLVPLTARGVTLGVAIFLRHRSPEPFDEDDLLLATELTARAALSIDNARQYTQQRDTALALQRSLLPSRTPRQAAVEVAFRYLPAGGREGVGGDWFDVIPLSGARVALVVGDVVGHGVPASAAMGRLRTAVRTLADIDMPPDELLTHLDDLVLRVDLDELPEGGTAWAGSSVGATCLYAVYDPVTRTCSLARAGHPGPALVGPDGTVLFPELPAGPPLGLGGLPFEAVELEVPEGSVLALYTDGLLRASELRGDPGLGLDRLGSALTAPADSLEDLCDQVLSATLGPDAPSDDVALLLARTRSLHTQDVADWALRHDPSEVARARKLAAAKLTEWGLEEASFVTELVVSELITNAVRYGLPPIGLRLIRDGSLLICEVSDGSSTAPHLRRAHNDDEGGRGLLLVAQLCRNWGTRHTPRGKTIWAEQEF
ncbi:SpoIIE family protein phosphatase [Kitasatospora cineracea]|uniref:Serine phosphatase RsbU (Regulator of sigma subunit) n=1 Tax=Kitasatospora cineracea TaxID=88074 RepID=A0A3N4R6N0_9ACTN|nr:SpoIIE family protein phosphatase [Kitasatospora cineracea]RPE29183.1 serine phosphatase RsbU (regulator of sigma subunit) [Kitasatospora cineracea]